MSAKIPWVYPLQDWEKALVFVSAMSGKHPECWHAGKGLTVNVLGALCFDGDKDAAEDALNRAKHLGLIGNDGDPTDRRQ